jgi:3-methyladenine DNA glycosylase AlkC
MVSISSSKLVRERTSAVCQKIINWNPHTQNHLLFETINNHLKSEYELIPSKEKIGKGIVYISKFVAKEVFCYLNTIKKIDSNTISSYVQEFFSYGRKNKSLICQHFSLLLLAEFLDTYPENFFEVTNLIEKYANDNEWSIRETIGSSIIAGLKKIPEETIEYLNQLANSEKENLRRLSSECLRPTSQIKWLRNASQNERILEILSKLNNDTSIYVRKSVGNNIKDLTKYMPEKILALMQIWIKNYEITVHDELATEKGLNPEQKRLIWTIKHGMRWLKKKSPEFHLELEKILGKNYVLYFDEKKNRLARPL